MKRASTLLAVISVIAILAGCTSMPSASKHGPLLVGVTPDYPPVVFKESGSIVGIESDFAHLLAGHLGRPLKFVEVPWDGLIPALIRGDIDIIMSGMSVTDARKVRISFSEPYIQAGLGALIRRKESGKYNSPEVIMGSMARIGVQKDTTGDVFVQEHCPKARRIAYMLPSDAALDLLRQRIDVFISDTPALYWLASENEADLVVVEKPFETYDLAWGIRRNNQDLLIAVNQALAAWKQDGTFNRVVKRWVPSK
jgi:ABC-type amino acid transport substrate-binding protein